MVDHGPDAYDAYKQLDHDLDAIPDSEDNCKYVFNPYQETSGLFGPGSACDDSVDVDSDEWSDIIDNCPNVWNPGQENLDGTMLNGDELGDACDVNMDADAKFNWSDSDMDGDGIRYEGNVDVDGDSYIYNQDPDNDADNVVNWLDNFDWTPAYY